MSKISAQEFFSNNEVFKFVSYADPSHAKKNYTSSVNRYTIECLRRGHQKNTLGNSKNLLRCIECERLDAAEVKEEAKEEVKEVVVEKPTKKTRKSKEIEKIKEVDVATSKLIDEDSIYHLAPNTFDTYNNINFTTIQDDEVLKKDYKGIEYVKIPMNKALIIDDVVLINGSSSFLTEITSDFKSKTQNKLTIKSADFKNEETVSFVDIRRIIRYFNLDFSFFEDYDSLNDIVFDYKGIKLNYYTFEMYTEFIYTKIVNETIIERVDTITKEEVDEIFDKYISKITVQKNGNVDEQMKIKLESNKQFLMGCDTIIDNEQIKHEESEFMIWYLTDKSHIKRTEVKKFKKKYMEENFSSDENYFMSRAERVLFLDNVVDIYDNEYE